MYPARFLWFFIQKRPESWENTSKLRKTANTGSDLNNLAGESLVEFHNHRNHSQGRKCTLSDRFHDENTRDSGVFQFRGDLWAPNPWFSHIKAAILLGRWAAKSERDSDFRYFPDWFFGHHAAVRHVYHFDSTLHKDLLAPTKPWLALLSPVMVSRNHLRSFSHWTSGGIVKLSVRYSSTIILGIVKTTISDEQGSGTGSGQKEFCWSLSWKSVLWAELSSVITTTHTPDLD